VKAAAVCDGGDLDCGGGLLIAIRRALNGIAVGEVLEIRSRAPSVEIDLPAWCELAGHLLELVSRNETDSEASMSYFVRKGR
jgi:TusA-related sulfurtransferase